MSLRGRGANSGSLVRDHAKAKVMGAAPLGSSDSASAGRAIREMFTAIAPRYDLLNHLLSLRVDWLWWRRAARSFAAILAEPSSRALDLCCGTGDMTFALLCQSRRSGVQILGVDFSHAMLERARQKSAGTSLAWIEADALQLPFPDSQFELVTAAFGFRNLADYDASLGEILRVLKPGGECGLLDFGEPEGVIGSVYRIYFRRVLPVIGTLVSGVRGPYTYLPRSVQRFPSPAEMIGRMRQCGFHQASWTPYTFGIAGLYRGTKAKAPRSAEERSTTRSQPSA
jgi:demethylmenaquinone methyltransferase / 2-methoxy-6-polyprenyl-1,4-benzoquinol methylase